MRAVEPGNSSLPVAPASGAGSAALPAPTFWVYEREWNCIPPASDFIVMQGYGFDAVELANFSSFDYGFEQAERLANEYVKSATTYTSKHLDCPSCNSDTLVLQSSMLICPSCGHEEGCCD